MKIEYHDIDDLEPYANNPRLNEDAVQYVANSIKEFGFKVPVVIDKNNIIVAGHTRIKAARKLGIRDIPCIRADDLTDDQIKAYRLADNKTGEMATWDFDALNIELEDIQMDMEPFGFDDDPGEPIEVEEDDFDEETEVNEHGVERGDVWILGDHHLMCGNTADANDMIILMAGGGQEEQAQGVFTDPPYGVAIGDKNKMLNEVQKAERVLTNIEGDTMSEDELYDMLLQAMTNIREHCKDDACYYVTSPQGGSLGLMMMMMMRDAGLPVRHVLMWRKNAPTFSMGRLDYDYQHEPMFYTWTKSHNNRRRSEFRTSVWDINKPMKCNLHPTMKPIELVAGCILDSSDPGDIILDGFGGSGTTLIACEQLGRMCRMMELDPHYCDVIISRWEKLTGKEAVKVGE